jgi:hypothetical protein
MPSSLPLDVPLPLAPYVRALACHRLGGAEPRVSITSLDEHIHHVELTFDLASPAPQDDWRIELEPAFAPSFHWSPHLTPSDRHVVDQHSFRSPALVVASSERMLALVPDLDILGAASAVRWYLDLDAPANRLTLGMSDSQVDGHVLYLRKPGAVHAAGTTRVGFYLIASDRPEDRADPWRRVLALLWQRWGHPTFARGEPLGGDLSPYVAHSYRWAFDAWSKSVWQEPELDGKRVGAPAFIVNVTQSPNHPGPVDEREMLSIWNQAWFSSLRSASGLFRHARRSGDASLRERALLSKELALSAPMKDGLFPSVLATEMETVTDRGKEVRRSKGWATAYWGNSDRNPINRPPNAPRDDDLKKAPYHLLDMSWTALWMLRWHRDLEQDARLVDYAKRYAERLLKLQDAQGFFPAWLDLASQAPLAVLDDSPETSASATFLFELAETTGEARYRAAALRALEAVSAAIVPEGRWEDYETYWSCSKWGKDAFIGKKIARNGMHKQNSLSMFWTAEALLQAWRATGERRHLELGQRVVDELLMMQASWQPPTMHVSVLGGFGVMNADGEWNDARASLFAELIVRYGQVLELDEYVERGLAALRSSFVMMYCPENPTTRALWEKKYPFFGPEDYGFTMENYGHDGVADADGAGMGEFTIYDWGNGAAAEAFERMRDHLGDAVVLGRAR